MSMEKRASTKTCTRRRTVNEVGNFTEKIFPNFSSHDATTAGQDNQLAKFFINIDFTFISPLLEKVLRLFHHHRHISLKHIHPQRHAENAKVLQPNIQRRIVDDILPKHWRTKPVGLALIQLSITPLKKALMRRAPHQKSKPLRRKPDRKHAPLPRIPVPHEAQRVLREGEHVANERKPDIVDRRADRGAAPRLPAISSTAHDDLGEGDDGQGGGERCDHDPAHGLHVPGGRGRQRRGDE